MARKILLADDSVTAQNMGRRILTDAGYEVITVNNGSAALKKIAEQLPELIVLDVYMPGYSGLEVCQRLKETRETARIPVLLTVGKLEPFKPEEARRARADAFIVKPFEASELLTALTKLEDKIVPQPTGKAGQFAKVWADLEQGGAGKTEKFGDAETGWKDRLIIPAPGSKQEEPEPEEVPAKAKGKKDKGKEKQEIKPLEVKAPVEATATAAVPADITAEEVAAIAAAAAAFEEKNQPPAEFAVKKSEIPEEPVAAASAPAQPEKVETKPVEAKVKEPDPAKEVPVVAVEATPKPSEPVVAKEAVPEGATAEVKTISAEPAPAASTSDTTGAVSSTSAVEKSAEAAKAVSAVPATPRWVAQEVPLPPVETGISLEQEMQKASTVLQAATAPMDLSSIANVEPPTPTPVEAVAPAPAAPAEVKVEEAGAAMPVPAPERPQEPAAAASFPESQPEVVTAVAAAASAGTSAPESKPEAVSQPTSTTRSSGAAASAPETKANESELAAAWAQWKQIRETVVGSQLTSQIADVAVAGLKDTQPVEAAAPAEMEEGASAGNPTAIASIVDTVLAELKPKLMAEIAKKLGDDNQKKKK